MDLLERSPEFIIWTLVPLVGGLVVWWSIVQSRRTSANLQALAQRLGLEFVDEKGGGWARKLLVSGRREGRSVTFYSFTTGSGKSRVHWCAVSVLPNRTGWLTFHIERQGLATKIGELFGAKEIVVGDPVFDAAWFVRTNRPDFLRAALLPEVRTKLMAAHAVSRSRGHFKLEEAALFYAENGTFADAATCARLEQMLPLLNELADIAEVSAEPNP